MEQSIEAYRMDGFIYMWRNCRKQNGNKLKTYFVRYVEGSSKAKHEYVLAGGRV